jgi:hypothetical protein
MNYSTNYSISQSLCVKITPSNITANLIKYGTSVITSGHKNNLTLNPGEYSIDPDAEMSGLNASVSLKTYMSFSHYAKSFSSQQDWRYAYSCRPYYLYYPIGNISMIPIEHSDQKCFFNRSSTHRYLTFVKILFCFV